MTKAFKSGMRYHMCLDIRGAITRGLLKGFQHDDGREMTEDEAREALFDELAKGRKVIPLSACDNFDYQDGCQGHPTEKDAA
jgi:hypothetical protein